MNWIRNNAVWLFLAFYAVFACSVILSFTGTGDTGDSVLHYLYARSAPIHPELYLNHWAKPVFTLFASPFAQFGFDGIKVFNSLVVLLTLYLTHKAVVGLQLKRPLIALLIIVCSPLLIVLTFSGLTEPLFALFTIWALYLVVKQRLLLACIVISFLPFVRSEGLIVISAFGFYFLLEKKWKMLPWLLFGHVVYSLIGMFYYEDILWVFTKIPYASTGSIYGKGDLLHFVKQLPYVIGIPSFILLCVGTIKLLFDLIQSKFHSEIHAIVLCGFLSYFVAHSLFWYFGIFNSMGLNRVLIGVIPFIAIIGLIGANTIIDFARNNRKILIAVQFFIVGIVVVFPFTSNPAAVHWSRDMNITGEQKAAQEICEPLRAYGGYGTDNERLVYHAPYLSIVLGVDHFNSTYRSDMNPDIIQNYLREGDVIIWDSWFSVVDAGVPKKMLEDHPNLKRISTSKGKLRDLEIEYVMYVYE